MRRFALKTMTYGCMHLTVAVSVAYALTRSWKVALAVGVIEPVVQTFAFALHERAWARVEQRRAAAEAAAQTPAQAPVQALVSSAAPDAAAAA